MENGRCYPAGMRHLAAALALLLPACTPSAPVQTDAPGSPAAAPAPASATPAPSSEIPAGVHIRGRITVHHRSVQGEPPIGTIQVEGSLEPDTRHDKAVVRITRDTKIFKGRGGRRMPFNSLVIGTLVEATFTGPVAESYPVQATASEVVILEKAPGVTPEATPSGSFEGTAGATEKQRPEAGVAILRSVRAASQDGFDRVVFEFEGSAVPGYRVEYVDRPVLQCGSGEPVEVAGDGWLQVRLTPAQAHTEAGEPTVPDRERRPGLPVLQELQSTCDFEADVTWVLGVAAPNRYRVQELSAPARLIVDVRH